MGRTWDRERVNKIKEELSKDPLAKISRNIKIERVAIPFNSEYLDKLDRYIEANKNELKAKGLTSRNKIVNKIIEEWIDKNIVKSNMV